MDVLRYLGDIPRRTQQQLLLLVAQILGFRRSRAGKVREQLDHVRDLRRDVFLRIGCVELARSQGRSVPRSISTEDQVLGHSVLLGAYLAPVTVRSRVCRS